MTYAGMGAPEPNFEWLLSHPSRLPNQTWETVFDRAGYHEDDGHMCKMIRGMKHAENVSKPYDHLPEFKVKQHMFLPAAIAAIDSGSKQPMEWTKHFDLIRGVGYPEAWEKIPLRSARVPEKSKVPLTNGTSMTNVIGSTLVNGTTPIAEKLVKPSEKLAQIPERPAQAPQAMAQVSAKAS